MSPRIALFVSCLALAGAAAAQEVAIGSTVRIGGDVEVSTPTEGPLHLAAGNVRIDAPVQGNVRAAGGNIDVGSGALISGTASFAGGDITVAGIVKEDLHAVGGDITLNGTVGGDVSVAGGSLRLGPDARIAGSLKFRGDKLRRDAAAQVSGRVEHVRRPTFHDGPERERTVGERFLKGWLWTAGLMVLAALIAAALPGPSQRMGAELRARPWLAPLLGLIALTSIPAAALVLVFTVIGIPIAVLALIAYAALLLVGYVWLAVVVGGLLLDRVKPETAAVTAWRVGAAVLAMLALGILVRVPFLGGLVTFAALAVGVGMIVLAVFHKPGRTLFNPGTDPI